jgi:hypothetical protein
MGTQPLTSAPPPIEDLADGCVRFVQQALGLPLDYTPETLPIVDHYIRTTVPKDGNQELMALVVPAMGAYFGEVIRRAYGAAHWHCPDPEDYSGFRLEFERYFLAFNPMGMVVEAVMKKDVPGWHAHFSLLDEDREAVRTSLELTTEVRAEDYYSLAVRYEVIDQILGVLASQATARGDVNRQFSRAVYKAAGVDDD